MEDFSFITVLLTSMIQSISGFIVNELISIVNDISEISSNKVIVETNNKESKKKFLT